MSALLDREGIRDDRDSPDWVPLKVVARMGEPIVHYEDGLYLDGPLAYGAFCLMPDRASLPPINAVDWPVDFDLPVAKWAVAAPEGDHDKRLLTVDGRAWGWCCSAAVVDWQRRSTHMVRKHPAIEKMVQHSSSKSFHRGAGHMKAYNLPMPTCFAHEIKWFVLGDKDGVERLLTKVRHLGKKVNHGNGRVLSWAVEEIEQDKSIWDGDKLMRRMPASVCDKRTHFTGSIRAPYFHHSRVMLCVGPDNENL